MKIQFNVNFYILGSAHKCPFLQDNTQLWDFRDEALAEIMDIEELVELGQRLKVCPYYGTREAVDSAQIVTLPYPLLLQESARNALNLTLKDNICIIDEAHNLIDAICSMHSSSISFRQVCIAETQLQQYFLRFEKRLNGNNRMHIKQLIKVVYNLKSFFLNCLETNTNSKVINVDSLLVSNGADQINLHHLSEYLNVSKLARKVDGYTKYMHSLGTQELESLNDLRSERFSNGNGYEEDPYTPVLMQLESFLLNIANPAPEGKLFYEKQTGDNPYLKYLLLDPSKHVEILTEQCRSVNLAGGTMSPIDDFINLLFSDEQSRILPFSCDHIVPPENITTILVSQGPAGVPFEFTHKRKDDENLLKDLGRTLQNFISIIPDGVVVFFPSFAFLQQAVKVWEMNGITNRLNAKKPLFIENKDFGDNPLDTFEHYKQSVDAGLSGMLFSVIGGRLSEGINFSDKLGRAVMVVGMPFPNSQDVEWQAKVSYVEEKAKEKGINAKQASQEFYENTCMRAVNQSIGRAIRHRDDYASIILLDSRYNRSSIQRKLPNWLSKNIHSSPNFGPAIRQLATFFRAKKMCD